LFGVNETNKREEDGLSGRGFDDGGFSYTSSIEIDVGTFFLGFGGWVKIKQFDNVANEVG